MSEAAPAPGRGLVIEADYTVLKGSPANVGAAPQRRAATPVMQPAAASGLDALLRADSRPFKPFARAGGWAFWTAGFVAAGVSFWVSGGHVLLR